MISRFGRYSGGERKALADFNSSGIKSDSSIEYQAIPYVPVFTPQNFEYTYTKGIWGLSASEEFPKAESRIVTSGLTSPLFSKYGDAWTSAEQAYIQYTINISRYANKNARVVFRLDNFAFDAIDYQIDLVSVSGTTYSFENTGESWQTTTAHTQNYTSATWTTLAVGTTNGRWNVDTGGTPSPGAANTAAAGGSYYVYAETTGTTNVDFYRFWLRSPVIALGATPTLSFYLCRFVAPPGPWLSVHLDII